MTKKDKKLKRKAAESGPVDVPEDKVVISETRPKKLKKKRNVANGVNVTVDSESVASVVCETAPPKNKKKKAKNTGSEESIAPKKKAKIEETVSEPVKEEKKKKVMKKQKKSAVNEGAKTKSTVLNDDVQISPKKLPVEAAESESESDVSSDEDSEKFEISGPNMISVNYNKSVEEKLAGFINPLIEAPPSSAKKEEPLKYLRYTISAKYSTERHLILKSNPANDCALQVANVPSYVDVSVVVAFIENIVDVPVIDVQVLRSNAKDGQLNQGQRTVNLVFKNETGPRTVLDKCEIAGPFCAEDYETEPHSLVLEEFCEQYRKRFTSKDELQRAADEYISKQDEIFEEQRKVKKMGRTKPDEEGWVTVVRGGRNTSLVKQKLKLKPGEVIAGGAKKYINEKDREETQKNYALPFYTYQFKKKRNEERDKMRSKFEDDKILVAMAKAQRKYRAL